MSADGAKALASDSHLCAFSTLKQKRKHGRDDEQPDPEGAKLLVFP
jgi:hypothetical protein